MAKLIVNHPKEYTNWMGNYDLYLNGYLIDSIHKGGSKEYELPEGNNVLKGKFYAYGSRDLLITVRKDERNSWKL